MKYDLNNLSSQPREKIESSGIASLSEQELIMVMLGSGIKGMPISKLAATVQAVLRETAYTPTIQTLSQIPGLGKAKTLQLLSSLELASRLKKSHTLKIEKPGDLWNLIASYGAQKQEYLLSITLNGAQEVLQTRVVTIGLLNQTQIHPREVFADAITDRAASVILAHNHPSGLLEPSKEDIKMTLRVKKAADIIGIPLLDHLIFNTTTWFSMAEKGLL